MTKSILAAGLALAAFGASAPVAAQTLNATFTGTATTSQLTPDPGQQTFTLNGTFLTYLATGNLPQITTDLPSYSFTITGISTAFDALTRTTTYGNVTGSIFYNYPGGSQGLVQSFAPTTLTATFDPTFTTAQILTSLTSTGPQTPPGFPGAVDLSPANGAVVLGTYVSNGPQNGTVTGSITFPAALAGVPEPATWGLMLVGFGLVGAGMRARRRTVRYAAA